MTMRTRSNQVSTIVPTPAIVLLVLAVTLMVTLGWADTVTWDGDTSTDFETGANWVGDAAPADNLLDDTAVFGTKGSAQNPALTTNRQVNGIEFRDGGWTLGGSAYTLTVGAGGVNYISNSTSTNTITANIELGADSTWIISDAGATTYRTLQVNGVISGSGSLTKTGTATTMDNVYGILTLRGLNTYTGQTILDRGGMTNTIDFNSIGNVNGGPSSLGAPTTVANGTVKVVEQIALRYTGSGHATDRELELAGSGGYAMLYAYGSGALQWNGDVKVTGTDTKRLALRGSSTADNAINGLLSDGTVALHLQKWDSGNWTLGNDSNDYTGLSGIGGGTLNVTSLADEGVASALGAATGSNARIQLGTGGYSATLRYVGTGHGTNRMVSLSGTTGSVAISADGTGTVSFTNTDTMPTPGTGAKTFTFDGTNTGDNTFAIGIIDNSPTNKTSLVKSGAGKWILSGANTCTGTTTVTAGTLLVNGTHTGGGDYTVAAAATFGGNGVIGDSADIDLDGALAPGASIGTLTAGGDLVTNDGASYQWELGDGMHDLMAVGGDLTINDTLTVVLRDAGANVVTETDTLDLFTYGGALSLGNIVIDDQFVAGLSHWDTSNVTIGFDTDSVFLTGLEVVPEPSTFMLLALGLLGLMFRRRKRE